MKRLPVATASHLIREIREGTSLPWLVGCDDDEESVVAKLGSSLRGGHDGATFELAGSLLARHFRIETPPVVLVRITDELAASLPARLQALARANRGFNFGTRYLAGLTPWIVGAKPTPAQRQEAGSILGFDALLANGDRTKENHNLLVDVEERIVVIDHEITFQYLITDGAAGDLPGDVDALRDHPLYPSFVGRWTRPPDFELFEQRLAAVSPDVVARIMETVSSIFPSSDLRHVRDRLVLGHQERTPLLGHLRRLFS